MGSVSSICSQRDYAYMYRYMNSTNIPVKDAIGCDALTVLNSPIFGTTQIPTREIIIGPPELSTQGPDLSIFNKKIVK